MGTQELCISNVGVFDGVDGRVTAPKDVTVGDGVITSIEPAAAKE